MKKIRPFFIALILIQMGCSSMRNHNHYSVSDHFDGTHFFNPWGNNVSKSLWDVLKWRFSTTPGPWPTQVVNSAQPQLLPKGAKGSVHITYVGHATALIQDGVFSILTDPQWSDRASPIHFLGPKRIRQPGVELSKIDRVDLVLISHNHYDHMDLPTLRELDQLFHPLFVVPLGNAHILQSEGITNVKELDWWSTEGIVQLVPVQHWSTRSIMDRNQALWGGYVITISGKRIFFAGDTGYGPHFKMIHQRLGSVDLSLLPIGAYEPRWFMRDQHMNPEDAVKAHLDLGSQKSFAIHFETFRLTDESFSDPREFLKKALINAHLSEKDFFAPEVGETLILNNE